MDTQSPSATTYKWNPKTRSGYRLFFDAASARAGRSHPFHVQDWNCRSIVQSWDCESLEEAVDTLKHLFVVDREREIASLRRLFGQDA